MATIPADDAKAPLSQYERALRIVNAISIVPGLVILILAGVTGGYYDYWYHRSRRGGNNGPELWAFIGICPLALSAILGLAVVRFPPQPRYRMVVTFADFWLAAWALGMAIWSWAENRQRTINGHAASVLLLIFFIHAFFFLRDAYAYVEKNGVPRFSRKSCSRCPHCLAKARAKKTSVKAVGGGKKTYHRVPGRDDGYDEDVDGESAFKDARPSMDDETAPLV